MKLASGATQGGIVVGNSTDKYHSTNPIVRRLMEGFTQALKSLVSTADPKSIHEVGCGEGYWTIQFAQEGRTIRGSDFSTHVVGLARENATAAGVRVEFKSESIYDLKTPVDRAELIVCCEVLEHLERPELAVNKLAELAAPYLIASVPREPVWRILNMLRGQYLTSLGNTTGHLQNWSQRSFLKLLSKRFEIMEVRTPMPWTMVLARTKQR